MKIYSETALWQFGFWGGARQISERLTIEEMNQIEPILEELYPDGIDETHLNDLFAFDGDSVLEWIGLTEEEVLNRD